MGFLKQIFGKGDEKRAKQVEKQYEAIQSGEIDKIYPILKPGDWVGIKYGAIKTTLFGTPEDPQLVIGYGYDGPHDFIFLNQSDLASKSADEILEEAQKNIDDYEVEFNEVVPGKVVIVSGYDFCSEKILSESFRLELQRKLNSNKLLVSIPRRRNLMATSAQDDEEIMNQFMNVHMKTWNDDSYGNAPIIDALFVIEDGLITGAMALGEDS